MSRPRARSAWLRTARRPAAVNAAAAPASRAAPLFRYECSLWYRIWNHPIHWRSLLHRAGIVIAVLGAIGLIAHFGGDFVSAAGEWVKRLGPWGPALFVTLFVIGTPFFVPNSALGLLAGAVFGLVWGFVYIFIGGLIAESLIFWTGRRLFRERVEAWVSDHARFSAMRDAVTEEPIRLMILLRLSPIPFTPLCYMLSTTRVTYRQYLVGFVGYLPGNFVTVYFGFVAHHVSRLVTGADPRSIPQDVAAILGLGACVYLVHFFSRAAHRAIEGQTRQAGSAPAHA